MTFLNSFGANNTNIFTQLRHEQQILLEKEDEKEINFKKNTRSSQSITENTVKVSGRWLHSRPQIMNSSVNKVELLHDFSNITI